MRRVAVIDIGKTNAKVALVDLETLSEIDVRRTPNTVRGDGPYPHHDVERLWAFMLDALRDVNQAHGVDAIGVTTHGATAVLLDSAGGFALPVLDYEHAGPDDARQAYARFRPDFAQTGSPALPVGLNLGAQLFWQSQQFPQHFARTAHILMYPQYWNWRLSGVMAGEATSLGCHTDLWSPLGGDYSSLVDALGWRRLFPPLRKAGEILGPVLPAVAEATGLDPITPVLNGIHDSNASLVPHLLGAKTPFAVVSTGTWVVSMAIGGRGGALDPARDTLINVNAFGDAVPSARFMGGREYEIVRAGLPPDVTNRDIEAVLRDGVMLLPAVQADCGPFAGRKAEWIGGEPPADAMHGGQRMAALAFNLALTTTASLELIGSEGPSIVEGPFAANQAYLDMLASATGRDVLTQPARSTGTSIGTAMLALQGRHPGPSHETRTMPDARLADYASRWKQAVASRV